ncbi:MAG: hypothetical protein KGH49_00465 [Candidatus Micrarchaeota archaeon]|nr:hypothetical protein [Candidatus Micrarchaeota archaeon]
MRAIYREYTEQKPVAVVKRRKEQIIIAEIGFEEIATATSFVEYVYEKYGFSRSCIWYNLKKLKHRGVLDFAEKSESEVYKPLYLTDVGVGTLRAMLSHSAAAPVAAQPSRVAPQIRYGLA